MTAPDRDEWLIALWLQRPRCPHQKAYRANTGAFLTLAHKPLRSITLDDLQAYCRSPATASQARRFNVVKITAQV
jgi:hypothetical protein